MRVLVVNAGSSSVKLRVIASNDSVEGAADLAAPRGFADEAAIVHAVQGLGSVQAVGHRIVHGGTLFSRPVVIDGAVTERLEALTDLAPLHQPKSLAALEAVTALLPDTPAVACFDTAFHSTLPPAARTYALPPEWRRKWDLRRFGFHGLSHAYASRRAAALLNRPPESLRIVTCHLGAGASLAAVERGLSVDTTTGFTPLEGLVMATRSGSVDPGLVLWLEEHAGMPPAELAATLEYRSGLLGLAGSPDMREIVSAVDRGDRESALAFEVYIHRLRSAIGSMVAAMGGLEAIVFTGGVGENSPRVRAHACSRLRFLGIEIDPGRNEAAGAEDREIGTVGAPVSALLIKAREDLEIAHQVRSTLSGKDA